MSRIDSTARKRLKAAMRDTKRAVRQGVKVEIDHSQLKALQRMHQANILAKNGLFKHKRFFELIPKYFLPGQDYDLYAAKKDNQLIAALLLFYFNKTVEYISEDLIDEVQPGAHLIGHLGLGSAVALGQPVGADLGVQFVQDVFVLRG